ncbi:hypothetical protein CBS101457_006810 [Exobasidium rhododendri]|nr:hypothetical protein CBS101457_006810 [Exobasidium rhododendri]
MEFPSTQADSPTLLRGIAGPSRARLEARQQRNSTSKPYDRSTIASNTPKRAQPSSITRHDSFRSANSFKSSRSKANSEAEKANGVGGLLSGLREAIFSKPLSWFGSGRSKTQNSSSSLPSHAQQTAAQRLVTSVKAKEEEDIESHRDSYAGRSKFVQPPPMSTNKQPLSFQSPLDSSSARSPSPARSSASAVIQSHGRSRLSVGLTPQSPRYGGSTLGTPGYKRNGSVLPESSGSVNGMTASQSSPSYAFGFGSERRLGGLSSAASTHAFMSPSPLGTTPYSKLPSRSPFAMNRHTIAGSSTAESVSGVEGSPRFGGSQLGTPSRSRPLSVFGESVMNRSRAGSIADSRMSTSSQTPKRREWSSLRLAPPKVHLSEGEELMQAYMAVRDGEGSRQGSVHPALQEGSDASMLEFGAGPSATQYQMGSNYNEGSLKRGMSMSLDGDDSMSDLAPRKRQKQMVWDQTLGFVSKDDLRARQIPKAQPKNEAERLLNALEGMRPPLTGATQTWGEGSRSGTPSRQMMSVPVPLAVSERSGIEGGQRRAKNDDYSKTVSPYSRVMKQRSKLSQSMEVDEGEGLRSRLRKPMSSSIARSDRGKKRKGDEGSNTSMDDGEEDDKEEDDDSEEVEEEGEEEEEEEEDAEEQEEPEPPRRKREAFTGKSKEEERKTLRSGKTLPPPSPSSAKRKDAVNMPLSPSKLNSILPSPSKPLSKARLEISVSGSSAANRLRASQQPMLEESTRAAPAVPLTSLSSAASPTASLNAGGGFKVLTDSMNVSSERSRSMLRQGAEKQHRTHAKSGRIGLDDDEEDDDEEDLPEAEELIKIKLPTNLFPQGFTFSKPATPSHSNGSSTPNELVPVKDDKLPAATIQPGTSSAVENLGTETAHSGNSLFGRLGGFAPGSKTSVDASKSTTPSFSFQAPIAVPTPAKPVFSFQAASPSASPGPDATTASKATPLSNFFAKSDSNPLPSPFAPATTQKDGPIPDFFASSLAKSGSSQGEVQTGKGFSFGDSAASKPVAVSSSSPAPFNFGAPANAAPAPASTSSFSFAPTTTPKGDTSETTKKPDTSSSVFPGFGSSSATPSAQDKPQSAPSFGGFGAASSLEAPKLSTTPSFGSSNTSATVTSPFSGFSTGASKKRGTEDDQDAPAKKANGFNSSPAFSFGGGNGDNSTTGKSQGGFGSGNKVSSDSQGSTSTPAGLFSFSTPTESTTDDNASLSKAPVFGSGGGGAAAAATDSMDTSPSSNAAVNRPASNLFGSSSEAKPTFSFGAPASSSTLSAPTMAPNSSQGAFTFGSPAPAKSDHTTTSSATPSFNFGGQSSTGNSSGGGGGGMFGQPPQPTASTTSHAFGSSSSNAATANVFGHSSNNNNNSGGFGSISNTAESSRQSSPAPFSFGNANANTTTSQPMSGFGAGFGSQPPSMSSPVASKPSFAFGAPSNGNAAPNTGGAAPAIGGGFQFSLPPAAGANTSNSLLSSGANSNGNSAPSSPFVFGSADNSNSTPPPQAAPTGGFSFGMISPAPPPSPGGGSLFNMGAPPPAGSGNRPVRGMPARRKR